ncbi:RloB domain-containing protein [Staphylococcus petrasii]|uniref:RloB domain-containing protein n=1 Tax=Staphylococcus petrasii TaxID=1276936 RepID=UPI001F597B66|nr:RloB domain-containing protein [Staphylococcus petrasii]MCI2774412.1 RloB family protein [Staphylococcus petrasii]
MLEPKKVFFIFTEGVKTEQLYFQQLSIHEKLREDIVIRVMNRSISNEHNSNQLKLVQILKTYINKVKGLNVEDIKKLKEEMNETNYENANLNDILEAYKLTQLLENKLIDSKEELKSQFESLLSISEYNEGFDEISIVIDRDRQSFKENQYDEVLKIVEENNFYLYVTNPNFELFLLLHLKNLDKCDQEEYLKNAKVTRKKKMLEVELNEECEKLDANYKKNRYDPLIFIERLEKGKLNAQSFAIDNKALKYNFGTSVFNLIDKLVKFE